MTTDLKDTSIEVAGRRLNPQVLPEWQLLLSHIEISEGFSFVVLLVPDADWANACRLALSHSLDAQGKSLLTLNFSGPEDFQTRLPGRLLDLHVSERTGALWLENTVSEASPQFPEWQDAWRGMVARLNQVRNPLRRRLKVPLIFVAADWIQPVIRENAPDLWSVRTLVTRIQPLDEQNQARSLTANPTEQQFEGSAIDPDLALRTAVRLRSQTGKELALSELLYRAGRGLTARSRFKEAEASLREAIDLQHRFDAPAGNLAKTLRELGFCLVCEYKFDDGIALVQEARRLYAATGDTLGEASCLETLGNIVLERSDHATAQARFEEALSLYRKVGNLVGEANCIKGLGDIALERWDHATAQARLEEALPLYRRVDDSLGEANCIKSFGNLAMQRSDHATAQARFEEALSLYRHNGRVLGEANCIKYLGNIALERSDHATARARFEEALPLYRRVGDVLGEANSIMRLGDLALLEEFPTQAREKFLEALTLFERIAEPYSIGRSHAKLAQLEKDPAVKEEHLKAARQKFTEIDRPDLIAELEEGFKTTEGNDATHH